MIALQISEIKNFMGRLLGSDCFDSFLLEEASVTTYNTFSIFGRIRKEFYSGEEWADPTLHPYEFSMWKDMRGLCFELIKGKKAPVGFKFVLHLIPEAAERILKKSDTTVTLNDIKAFVLTIRYDGSALTCITGTSLRTFLPDKTPELAWDRAFRLFLDKNGIAWSE